MITAHELLNAAHHDDLNVIYEADSITMTLKSKPILTIPNDPELLFALVPDMGVVQILSYGKVVVQMETNNRDQALELVGLLADYFAPEL